MTPYKHNSSKLARSILWNITLFQSVELNDFLRNHQKWNRSTKTVICHHGYCQVIPSFRVFRFCGIARTYCMAMTILDADPRSIYINIWQGCDSEIPVMTPGRFCTSESRITRTSWKQPKLFEIYFKNDIMSVALVIQYQTSRSMLHWSNKIFSILS